jgi:hypothetical protein
MHKATSIRDWDWGLLGLIYGLIGARANRPSSIFFAYAVNYAST